MKLTTKYLLILLAATILYASLKTVITNTEEIQKNDGVISVIKTDKSYKKLALSSYLEKEKINTGNIFREERGFQPVTQDGLHVYSAFLGIVENLDQSSKIIIIGMDITKTKRNISCEFYDEIPHTNGTHYLEPGLRTVAKKQNSVDGYNTGLKYCPIFIECDIPVDMEEPKFVAVRNLLNSSQSINILEVHYPPKEPIYSVAACLQPLHTENVTEHNPLQLIEWLEFQKMMGVEHFTFYNLSASPAILKLLQTYDEVSVLPWNNPITSRKLIRAHGQFIQANDCAHRYRDVAQYVVTFDFDEFLIPSRNFADYFTLFQSILKSFDVTKNRVLINQLRFHAAISFSNWEKRNGTSLAAENYNVDFLRLPTMTKFVESAQMKFVMLPENIVESGVHGVKLGVSGSERYTVPSTVGHYLHFRPCSGFYKTTNPVLNGNTTCLHANNSYLSNDAADRFGGELVERVDRKVESLLRAQPEMWEYLEIRN